MPKNYNLYLKGDVGGWNFNADMVNWVLDKHKDSEVHVLIDSLGGYVHAALSISSLFKVHGNVHVHYVGMNASAATIAAMGAKRITIDKNALFLVHQCMNLVLEWDYMNADELDAHICELEKLKEDQLTIDGCIAGLYASRCKKSKDDLLALMKKGAWLTAEQALEWGFVDEITNEAEDGKPELTATVINTLASAGIPIPPIAMTKKKSTLLERFISYIQSTFSSNQAADDSTVDGAAFPSLPMEETPTLNSVTEEVAAQPSIDALQLEIKNLKAEIADKDRTIAELRQEPAAETAAVVDTVKDEDPHAPVSDEEAIAAAKVFLESFN